MLWESLHLQLYLAKEFLKAKTKNQINYLRYLDKYHKLFSKTITKMKYLQKQMLTKSKDTNELMGYEGRVSILYWDALAKMLNGKVDFTHRVTRGATDVVNSALNYGYGILYGRIYFHLVKAGLTLHISFLHKPENLKPTLVYDMIEEFRTFVVDRVIFRMFNQNEKLELDENGLLTSETKKRITSSIHKRLSTKTYYKNSRVKLDNIISKQAYLLARSINGLDKYKAFVGRY